MNPGVVSLPVNSDAATQPAPDPSTDSWMTADEVDRLAKSLDEAMNGPGGPTRRALYDPVGEAWVAAGKRGTPLLSQKPAVPGMAEIVASLEDYVSASEICAAHPASKSKCAKAKAARERHLSLIRALATSAVKVPDGWKLVPLEPTEAMLKAASDELGYCDEDRNDPETDLDHRTAYVAMLAAAPEAGS